MIGYVIRCHRREEIIVGRPTDIPPFRHGKSNSSSLSGIGVLMLLIVVLALAAAGLGMLG